MFRFLVIVFSLITLSYVSTATENRDAAPIERVPPELPNAAMQSGHCIVNFEINEQGRPQKIEARECTDALFKENAEAAVKQWIFSPKIVDGKPILMRNVENKLSFRVTDFADRILPEPSEVKHTKGDVGDELVEANPIYLYPGTREGLKSREVKGHCCASFAISQLGYPYNVEMENCSDSEFKKSANEAVRWSEFMPAILSARPVSSDGHGAVVKFVKVSKFWRWRYASDSNGYSAFVGSEDEYNQLCRQIS